MVLFVFTKERFLVPKKPIEHAETRVLWLHLLFEASRTDVSFVGELVGDDPSIKLGLDAVLDTLESC